MSSEWRSWYLRVIFVLVSQNLRDELRSFGGGSCGGDGVGRFGYWKEKLPSTANPVLILDHEKQNRRSWPRLEKHNLTIGRIPGFWGRREEKIRTESITFQILIGGWDWRSRHNGIFHSSKEASEDNFLTGQEELPYFWITEAERATNPRRNERHATRRVEGAGTNKFLSFLTSSGIESHFHRLHWIITCIEIMIHFQWFEFREIVLPDYPNWWRNLNSTEWYVLLKAINLTQLNVRWKRELDRVMWICWTDHPRSNQPWKKSQYAKVGCTFETH
jgi:hypothetical protein